MARCMQCHVIHAPRRYSARARISFAFCVSLALVAFDQRCNARLSRRASSNASCQRRDAHLSFSVRNLRNGTSTRRISFRSIACRTTRNASRQRRIARLRLSASSRADTRKMPRAILSSSADRSCEATRQRRQLQHLCAPAIAAQRSAARVFHNSQNQRARWAFTACRARPARPASASWLAIRHCEETCHCASVCRVTCRLASVTQACTWERVSVF